MNNELTVQEKKNRFKAVISQAIKLACSRLKDPMGLISYDNAKLVVADVQRVFLNATGTVPGDVQAACNLALAPVAPSVLERMRLIKDALCLFVGVAGIGAIITAIGTALGWGAGIITIVIAWFTGASLLGPIVWALGGVSLTVIAGYFIMKDTSPKVDVFEKSLIDGVSAAVDTIWQQYGDRLMMVV